MSLPAPSQADRQGQDMTGEPAHLCRTHAGNDPYCPAFALARRPQTRAAVLFLAISIAGGMVVATQRYGKTGHVFLAWQEAALVGALSIAGLVLHETGHAVAAKMTGRRVERLEFGLAAGAVTSGGTTPSRRAAAIAAGPLLELGYGLALWAAAGGTWAALAAPVGVAGLMASTAEGTSCRSTSPWTATVTMADPSSRH